MDGRNRALLEALEASGADTDLRPALALAAGREVALDARELNAARRRAIFLLAAGGDPQLGLDLDGRAVRALAAELDDTGRRATLRAGLEVLGEDAGGLPFVAAALDSLLADVELAWRAYACALLAEELGEDT